MCLTGLGFLLNFRLEIRNPPPTRSIIVNCFFLRNNHKKTTMRISTSVKTPNLVRKSKAHEEMKGTDTCYCVRLRLKCDGTCAETRFRPSAKLRSPFKSAGPSVQSTTGTRGVHISGSNAGYTMLRGSVKGTGYPLHSPVSPLLPLPCFTVCHHI
jgi:hypothetical protein